MNTGNEALPGSDREQELWEKACKVLPGGVSRNVLYRKPHPWYVKEAKGCYVTDIYGKQRVDFANNIASLIHGHAHPAIVDAVCTQVQRGTAFTIGTEVEVEYATQLCERVESYEKIRFVNSGTEAVMAMIKAARAYTGKPKIAKAEGGYHGSFDTAEVSQNSSPSNWGDPLHPNSVALVAGTPKSVTDNVVIFPYNNLEATLDILNAQAGEIAAVIIDPVPHRIGMVQATPEFVEGIYNWTRQNGALLCFDEVICFRVNYGGAQDDYRVKPDLTTMGKIIGGGFPIGAFAGSAEVMNILDPGGNDFRFSLSGTFSANPISLTAGQVAMQMFDREAVKRINEISWKAIEQIVEAGKIAGIPMCITGRGSMFKIHFRETPPSSYREVYEDAETKKIMTAFLDHVYEQGIMMINSCSCVVSTVITQKEVDILSNAVLSGFRHIKPMLKT